MDLLLSVPLFSYLLAPSTSSFSTSLNLVFFYLTWSTLLLSQTPLKVHVVGVLAVRVAFFLLPALASLAFDVALPSLAGELKYGGRGGLPDRNPRALAKLLGLAGANLLLLTAAEAGLSWAFALAAGEPEFRTTTTLPLPWEMFKHVLALLVARECLLYCVHRFVLHGGSALARLHKTYAHASSPSSSSRTPFSLALMADHPLPLLLHRLLPLYLPAAALRPHLLTYFLLVAVCTAEETLAMSGYAVVPGFLMSGVAQRTAVHYAGDGATNYGAWGVLDWVGDTSEGGRSVLEDVRREAEERHLKARSKRRVDHGVGALRDGVGGLVEGMRTRSRGRKS